jgi:hypothetical protein
VRPPHTTEQNLGSVCWRGRRIRTRTLCTRVWSVAIFGSRWGLFLSAGNASKFAALGMPIPRRVVAVWAKPRRQRGDVAHRPRSMTESAVPGLWKSRLYGVNTASSRRRRR